MNKVCNDCETVAHCTKHGCVPKQQALAQPVQEFVALGKPTDEMVQAATDEYDEWAFDNKGTTECIRAMLVKALKVQPTAQPAPVQEPLTVKLKDDWRTDDWGKPIIYDTDEVDEVTGALTGDEGEEDSLTVLNSMARYVSNVWPGKTALQVLIECEEAMIATPPAAQRQWVGLEPEEIAEILSVHYMYMSDLVRAIEAKLKEKNNG